MSQMEMKKIPQSIPPHRILPHAAQQNKQLPDLLPVLFKTMNNMIDMRQKLQQRIPALEQTQASKVPHPHSPLQPRPLQASSHTVLIAL